MYIQGHIDIINEVLPEDYFDSKDKQYTNFTKHNLIKGLKYIDVPCGGYKIRDGKILFEKKKLCEFESFFHLFLEKTSGETPMYQHHKGFFSHLHSMTTDPENSVEKIRNKIVLSIIGYAMLAVFDKEIGIVDAKINPHSMWMGMVLHIITDSYSPAHTIRNPNQNYNVINDLEAIDDDKKMRLDVHAKIKTAAKEKKMYDKKPLLKSLINENNREFIVKNKKQLWDSYKAFKFEYDLNKMSNDLLETNASYKVIGKQRMGDIVAFQYYGYQTTFSHLRFDFLKYTRDKPLIYKRMKNECMEILMMYKKVLLTGDIKEYVSNLIKFLLEGPFRIHSKYLKDKTNKIISDYN